MPAIPIAAAAIGVGSAIAGAASGVGKNDSRQGAFDTKPTYDPNKFEWGGQPGLAGQDANYFRNGAGWAQGRQGPEVNYGDANWDRFQSGRARWGEEQAAGLMMNRAQGGVPSIAGQQAAVDMGLLQQQGASDAQRVAAAQASAGASARGAAGLALAGQTAASNTATAQSAINRNTAQGIQNISNQAQVNAAMERMQAEQGAMGAYSQMRGGDFQAQQNAAAMAQYQANLGIQQRQLNDAYSMGMFNNEQNVRANQLNAGANQQQMLSGSHTSANQMNAQINQANADRGMKFFQGGVGAATDTLKAAGTLGGGRADGGPVEPGKTYLVGERGPELIVPQQHGLVVPAEQTKNFIQPEIMPLDESPELGLMLQQDAAGHAYLAQTPEAAAMAAAEGMRPSLAGSSRPAHLRTAANTPPPARMRQQPAPKKREMTPEEMMAAADAMMALMQSEHSARMASGPRVAVQPASTKQDEMIGLLARPQVGRVG